MKAALLCNGPSRVAYSASSQYNYVMGCNVPWTKVDSTVVIDKGMATFWWNQREKFDNEAFTATVPIYMSNRCWMVVKHKTNADYWKERLLGFVDAGTKEDSSGHVAARQLIALGYKEIDIYGCDAWFKDDTVSYTHEVLIKNRDADKLISNAIGWRKTWNDIMQLNPDVKLNFIE
jgi:hypothetical protein